MTKLIDEERWAPLIGRFFIAFGRIESTTHECIRDWAGVRIHKYFARASLSSRLDLARDLVDEEDAEKVTKDHFIAAIAAARDLSKYRNLIAHSPLCLVLFQNEVDTPFLEAIASNTNDRHILFEELEAAVRSAEKCANELSRAFATFRVEKMDFEVLQSFPGLRKPE